MPIVRAKSRAALTSNREFGSRSKYRPRTDWPVWNEVPKFKDLPNAAISVYPGSLNNGIHVVNWNVNWDDPVVKAGGNCQIKGSEVIGFEDYSR